MKTRLKYFKLVPNYSFFSLLSLINYKKFHIKTYFDDLDGKGPHIFWTKLWDSSHSAASTMRPVAAARGAGPEILVEPSVFREVRPALVDWQALKNPFQKNPVFFHVSWSDIQEKYITNRTIWSLSRPLSTNKHQPGVSNRWEIYFYFKTFFYFPVKTRKGNTTI